MGFQPSQNHRAGPGSLAEINVTPLVDVMLVLLIVFMISAPLMQQGIQVELPKTSAGSLNETPDQLVISILRSRQISIADHTIPAGTFFTKISAIAAAKSNIEVVIQADQNVSYGFVAQVMAEVKRAGIHHVGLATQSGASHEGSPKL